MEVIIIIITCIRVHVRVQLVCLFGSISVQGAQRTYVFLFLFLFFLSPLYLYLKNKYTNHFNILK